MVVLWLLGFILLVLSSRSSSSWMIQGLVLPPQRQRATFSCLSSSSSFCCCRRRRSVCHPTSTIRKNLDPGSTTRLFLTVHSSSSSSSNSSPPPSPSPLSLLPLPLLFYGTISVVYWYWMILGAWAASQGWPGIPEWLPLHPGFPPSDVDLQPVLDDAPHFFYLSELLGNEDAPYVQPVRLAVFNLAEAWIWTFLPLLWTDPQRVRPFWILPVLWAILGINLTNAFLAPYLCWTELFQDSSGNNNDDDERNNDSSLSAVISLPPWWGRGMGVVAMGVVAYALVQLTTVATVHDWNEFGNLVQTDRTYLAFAIDLCLFSLFQPLVLGRLRRGQSADGGGTLLLDAIPLVGLLAWVLLPSPNEQE